MTPSFISRAQTNFNSGTSPWVCNMPASVAAGDLLIAILDNNANRSWTSPTGWGSPIAGAGGTKSVWSKIASGSEGATQTWTPTAGSPSGAAVIIRITGHDATTPINVISGIDITTGGNPFTTSGVTTTVDDCLILRDLYLSSASIRTWTTPGSTSQIYTTAVSSGQHTGYTSTKAIAGATGTEDYNCSSTVPERRSVTIAIAPAAGAMVGTGSASASASGTLTGRGGTGTGSAVASGSGTLTGRGALVGSASASGSGAGALSAGGSGVMVGSSTATSGAVGTLSGRGALLGSASATGSGSGSPSYLAQLVGSSEAFSDCWGFLTAGLPTRISETFDERWASRLHVGVAKPELRVEVRRGRFNRRYDRWYDAGFPIDAIVADSGSEEPWQAFWEPTEPYREIPGVRSVDLGKTFGEKGIASATIVIDNIAYIEEDEGYHSIHRGFLAPLRGYTADGRTELVDERGDPVTENEWSGTLNRKRQITVHEAYGDAEVKTFTGIIDDIDTTSKPAVITITARGFGQVFSDEEFVGWNIDKSMRDPVVFIDKDEADNIVKGGYNPDASTEDFGFDEDNVNDGDSDTYWRSASEHTGPGNTEFIEIHASEGRHSDFWLGTEYPDLNVYVSVKPTALANGDNPTLNGGDLTPDEWVDLSIVDEFSNALVPGTYGGIPFIRYIHHSDALVQVRELNDPLGAFAGGEFVMGDGSLIRVSFRNLYPVDGFYRAAVRSLYTRKRTLVDDAGATKWVRVGDISDVVKVVCRWAGFKEWEIESTGARLGKRLLANRGMKYMDIIDKVKDGVGFEFFLADPTAADESIGVPIFRKSLVVADDVPEVFTVTDQDLLTAVDVKETDENRAYIIRARGRESKTGDTFGGDSTKRIMYVYRPPWSGLDSAGVIRHVVHTNYLYKNMDDVRFAAWYIGLQEALESIAVGIEIPGYPGVDLDDIIVLEDLGTGLTTRLQVRERRSTHVAGEDASWTMTLSGAIIDSPDVQEILTLIADSRRDV